MPARFPAGLETETQAVRLRARTGCRRPAEVVDSPIQEPETASVVNICRAWRYGLIRSSLF